MSFRQVLSRSRAVSWFRNLSPHVRAIAMIVAITTTTAVLVFGGIFARFAWADHQFKDGAFCSAEPEDPLC